MCVYLRCVRYAETADGAGGWGGGTTELLPTSRRLSVPVIWCNIIMML